MQVIDRLAENGKIRYIRESTDARNGSRARTWSTLRARTWSTDKAPESLQSHTGWTWYTPCKWTRSTPAGNPPAPARHPHAPGLCKRLQGSARTSAGIPLPSALPGRAPVACIRVQTMGRYVQKRPKTCIRVRNRGRYARARGYFWKNAYLCMLNTKQKESYESS